MSSLCLHSLPPEYCQTCRAKSSAIIRGMTPSSDLGSGHMLNVQKLWDNLSETQQASILKMARMERGWHYASVEIRYNAEDHHFDGTWLREVLRAFAQCAPAS